MEDCCCCGRKDLVFVRERERESVSESVLKTFVIGYVVDAVSCCLRNGFGVY